MSDPANADQHDVEDETDPGQSWGEMNDNDGW
ncbi:hypothetical protein EV383_4430 [Pseudonocardia sediminis]|uniref:Uncharacterized protein n=1 Tax=Pseudonocardia sediminis TaxID=1397368 RepID=A0A4Q7V0A3_PSEST|nr:hypothetical protein EV383_4430 [Pseudonocardia sediminis]